MDFSRLAPPLCMSVALCVTACGKSRAPDNANAEAPPPGIRYEAHVSAGGVAPPAAEIKSPHSEGARANATAGGNLFASMNCDGCHGGGASGWVGPSLIDRRWRYGGADEEIFSSIYYGRPKGMPAYGGVIGADGVWMLVTYLTAQTVPRVVPTTSYENMSDVAPAIAATAAPAAATTPEQMLEQYGCVACHAIARRVIGPSLKEVAAQYKGHADAENTLAGKIRNGGSGVWGSVPMPPNPQVPDQDAHALVKWILTLG